jgi:asparagine synthase (glutamine-hydrolysing)
MCGIAGFLGSGEPSVLRDMTGSLAHRGPDGDGFWTDEGARVFLGHRRLSIVDLAAGSQPMTTLDDQLVITFNGEIYNHAELRTELEKRGHHFKTDHSDTEVLLYGYREWGPGLLEKLNGMWAFAIYDRQRRELLLSRDRFGKKPLFYYADESTFAFGSELTALRLHPAVRDDVDLEALQKYFAYGFIPAPWTLLAGTKKLPAGHWMKVSADTLRFEIQKYWEFELDPFETIPKNPEQVWGEELVQRLNEAVRCRLQADVPVGVFLSGGIDSTTIATLAAKHHPAIETFSIGFEERSFDEREFARLGAETARTTHHEQILSSENFLKFAIATAGNLDEVMGDSSIVPTSLVSRLARQNVKVVLGGDGCDELFAGYDPFRALGPAQLYSVVAGRKVNQAIRSAAEWFPVSHANMSFDFKLKRMLRGLSFPKQYWLATWMGPLDPREIGQLFGNKPDPESLYSEAIAAWNHPSATNDVDRAIQFFVRLYLQDDILVKIDRASMIHGLEARSPFLDFNVINLARRIPASYKLRGGITKYLFKQAVRGLIPDRVIDRAKKGFGSPIGNWFKAGDLKLNGSAAPGGIDWSWINRRLNEHRTGKRDDRGMLWCAWLLQHSPLVSTP